MSKTIRNLLKSLAQTSRLAARQGTYAVRAVKDGQPSLAVLFRALANSEAVQSVRMLRLTHGKIGNSDDNLENCFESELPEQVDFYGQAHEDAKDAGETAVAHAYLQLQKVSRKNLGFHKKLLANNFDADTTYYVCQFCGYIHEREAPESCPVCHAPQRRFQKV